MGSNPTRALVRSDFEQTSNVVGHLSFVGYETVKNFDKYKSSAALLNTHNIAILTNSTKQQTHTYTHSWVWSCDSSLYSEANFYVNVSTAAN